MRDPKCGLIVFAKPPVPGQVKTRLTGLLTPEDAAMLYKAFLVDALNAYARLPASVLLFLAASEEEMKDPLFSKADVRIAQQGHGLGERMAHAFAHAFGRGYERLVIIGTDHPTLPDAFVARAFEALSEPETIVIGPSHDGGYYLLGMNAWFPIVFEDMVYSHEGVFDETMLRIRRSGAGSVVLPMWYDVDDPESLLRLTADLQGTARGCPATRSAIWDLASRYDIVRMNERA